MADRIGIINKGELIVVEEKTKLMQKLGKRQLTLEPAGADGGAAGGAGGLAAGAQGGRQPAGVHLRRARRRGRAGARATAPRDIPSLLRRLGELGIAFKDLSTQPELAGGDLREPGQRRRRRRRPGARGRERGRLQPHRRLGHLPLRDGALRPHAAPERRHAGHHHLALLRGVRLGHRLAHVARGRRPLRRLHRAGPHHAVDPHRQHLQRLVRDLLPQVHRHDLRAALGADLVRRDDHRLRRRRRDQVDHRSASSSWRPRPPSCRSRSTTRWRWSPSCC